MKLLLPILGETARLQLDMALLETLAQYRLETELPNSEDLGLHGLVTDRRPQRHRLGNENDLAVELVWAIRKTC